MTRNYLTVAQDNKPKNKRTMKATFLALCLLFSTINFAQKIDTRKIDDFINHIETNNRGIGSVSIFKEGKEVYNRSFGQSQLEGVNSNSGTKYQIGSIAKVITATLIL